MKIHEYQAKEIFSKYEIPVPAGKVATTPGEVRSIADEIGSQVVVKAQVHVGGRGKAGGVKLADDPGEAEQRGKDILGMDIKGLTVEKVLVAKAEDIAKEIYIGIVNDRATKAPILIVSAEGGVEIEEVAKTAPEKIVKIRINPLLGITDFQARQAAFKIVPTHHIRQTVDIIKKLYRIYVENDCSLIEINPFIITPDDKLIALDAKINFDDNALHFRKDLESLRDPSGEDPLELRAKGAGLSYVKLDGNIGCIVNGAGLAMATMDLIKLNGAEPANFLDIGGGATAGQVSEALSIIISDEKVKAILVNIFGGITRCDDVARGLSDVIQKMKLKMPMVIRLVGTNEKEGRAILEKIGIKTAATLNEAAKKVVELVGD